MFKYFLLLVFGLLMAACGAIQDASPEEIPLAPLEYVTSAGGVAPWRSTLHIRDRQLQMVQFGPEGELMMQSYDEVTFPTDVLIVYSESDSIVSVFLRRSPHGGCLLLWKPEVSRIHDPCSGSNFDLDGAYISGPALRSLDMLPASVRDGMIWVGSEVIYGEPHQ